MLYQFFQSQLDFTGRHFLAVFGGVTVCKEELQRKSSPFCLGVFHVADTRYGTFVESCTFFYILENHRFQVGLVAIEKECFLSLDDGFHRDDECVSALPDGFDESLCLVNFLLGIEQCLLVLPAHVSLVLFIGVYHVGK